MSLRPPIDYICLMEGLRKRPSFLSGLKGVGNEIWQYTGIKLYSALQMEKYDLIFFTESQLYKSTFQRSSTFEMHFINQMDIFTSAWDL